jgi:hypothetical protein
MYVEVILWHFHRPCYKSSPLWFFVEESLSRLRLTMDEYGEHRDLYGLLIRA